MIDPVQLGVERKRTLVTRDNFGETLESIERDGPDHVTTIDTETNGLDVKTTSRVCGLSLLRGDGAAFYFPVRHAVDNIDAVQYTRLIHEIGTRKRLRGFNIKFDLQALSHDGLPLPEAIVEVMAPAHLLNENEPSFALKKLSDKYLGAGASDESAELDDLLLERRLRKSEMWRLPPKLVAPYACADVELTAGLDEFYQPAIDRWGLAELKAELSELCLLICRMELRGLRIDTAKLLRLLEESHEAIKRVGGEIAAIANAELSQRPWYQPDIFGHIDFNPGSPKQICDWLGLESSDADALDRLDPNRPGVRQLQEFRSWSKVNGTYYTAIANALHKGRLHSSIRAFGTISGRLSSAEPVNLMALPTNEPPIYRVKELILPDNDDDEIVEADWSQAELRAACHLAPEERMGEELRAGRDIHAATAGIIGTDRQTAKIVNFSILYGMGHRTLAQRLRIPERKAKEILAKFHMGYPGFRRLSNRAEALAEARGYIRLFTGRLRHFNDVRAPTHKAISNLVQGSIAEQSRRAMQALGREKKLLLQVHDSLVFSAPKGDKATRARVREVMEHQPWCSLPMPVSIKVGPNYGQLEKVGD